MNMEQIILPKQEKKVFSSIQEAILAYEKSEGYEQLREHQKTAFKKIRQFIVEDEKNIGYLNMPTGSGKTVLFSKIIEALFSIEKEGKKFKTIILVPNKGLVDQVCGKTYTEECVDYLVDFYENYKLEDLSDDDFETKRTKALIGEMRKIDAEEKKNPGTHKKSDSGLAQFAPDIRSLAYHSKADNEGKNIIKSYLADDEYNSDDFDAVVMTYQSLNKLVQSGKIKANSFDLLICDEVHRTLGEVTGQSVDFLEGLKLGFTATDKFSDDRKVIDKFPNLIWKLGLNDAIEKGILAKPIIKEIDTQKSITYNGNGDIKIEDQDQGFMEDLEGINQEAVVFARKFIEDGKQGIISCMPKRTDLNEDGDLGDTYHHAKEILEALRETDVVDKKTGEKRKIKAEIIDGNVSDELRRVYYAKYKNGEIDCFAYVDALREGWDSEECNFLINIRPTLSEVLATQRLGRILRKNGDIIPELVDFLFSMKKGKITMDNNDKQIIRSSHLYDSGVEKKERPKEIMHEDRIFMRAFAIYEKMNLIKSLAEDVCNRMNKNNQVSYIDGMEYIDVEIFTENYMKALKNRKDIKKGKDMMSIDKFCKAVNLFTSEKNRETNEDSKKKIRENIIEAYKANRIKAQHLSQFRKKFNGISFETKEVSDGGKMLNEPFYNYYGLLTALELRFKDGIVDMKKDYIKNITEKEMQEKKILESQLNSQGKD